MTFLYVKLNILIHSWPIIGLQNAFFCFKDAIVTSEDVAVSVAEDVRDDVGRSHDDDTFLRRVFKTSPKDAIFNERLEGQLKDQISKSRFKRQLFGQ